MSPNALLVSDLEQVRNLYIHTDFGSKFCILYRMLPCWEAVWREFSKFALFSVSSL